MHREKLPPYLYLAEFHLEREEPAVAESVLLKGLELLPDNVHLHKLLIKVYVRMGDEARAASHRSRLEELVKRRRGRNGPTQRFRSTLP